MAGTKVAIGERAYVEITWNVLSVNYSKDKEKSIKELFATKYGIKPSHVKVVPNYIALEGDECISLNSETIKNVHDPKFQQALFPECLKEHNITDYDLDALIQIDSQMNSLIDYDSYEKGRKYTLKWLDWSNFLSYGPDNHIDFEDLHGLILLNSMPANQGGKSTFAYDLLHFLFFGRTTSGKAKTLEDLFNNHLPKETELKVEGCINIDGEDYIVKRTLTRPAATRKTRPVTQKVEYFRLLSDGSTVELEDNENLNEGNNVKTSQAIKEAIGNERDFDLVISANSDNLKELISLKETDRGRLLSRWIGLLPLQDKDVKAREKWNREISVNRYVDRYNTQELKNDIESLNARINDAEEQIQKNTEIVAGSTKKISDYNNTKETLLASKKEIKQELFKVDVTTLEESIKRLVDTGKQRAAEKQRYEDKIAEIGEVNFSDEKYKATVKEKEPLITEIANIKNDITNLKTTNKNLKESEYCPLCKRKFDNVDNSATIAENEKKIKELISLGISVNEKKNELEATIAKMDVDRATFNEKNRYELLVSKLEAEIANKRSEYKEKKQLLKEINENKAAIQENNRIDASLNIVNQNIRNEEAIKNTASERITSFKRDIEQYKSDIIDKNVIIKKIEEEVKTERNWKTYLMLIGKDGISKMVLRNALPIINSELRRFLDGVCDFDVEVEINEKNDVDFIHICKDDGVRQRLAAGSGFEQTAAALALRVVLGNMSSLSKPPFLFLDEVLGNVADENYDSLKLLYDKIAQNFAFVLQVTHNKQIYEWHNKTITVVKKDHVSKIEVKQ